MADNSDHFSPVEAGLLIFIAIVVVWMIVEAFTFSDDSSFFPLLSSGIVLLLLIIYGILLLVPKRYKEKLRTRDDSVQYGQTGDDESQEETDSVVVFVIFAAFVILAYFVGFLLSTPLYVYLMQIYLDYGNRLNRLTVSVIAFLIVLGAYLILGIPLDQGYIFNIF